MKAIVCVKQVPDTSGKVAVNPDGTLNRASMATIINPDDKNAVEAALKLKKSISRDVRDGDGFQAQRLCRHIRDHGLICCGTYNA